MKIVAQTQTQPSQTPHFIPFTLLLLFYILTETISKQQAEMTKQQWLEENDYGNIKPRTKICF